MQHRRVARCVRARSCGLATRTPMTPGSTRSPHARDGYDRVVVMAPLPEGHGAIPGAAQDAATRSAHARVLPVAPRIRPSAQRVGGGDRGGWRRCWRSQPRSWLVLVGLALLAVATHTPSPVACGPGRSGRTPSGLLCRSTLWCRPRRRIRPGEVRQDGFRAAVGIVCGPLLGAGSK